jgi:alpha-L-rhamnosidase
MNSFNHYSLGSIGEWLFRHVAGIELDPETVGFQRFALRPFIGHGLSFAKASYATMHGEILSDWRRSGTELIWSVRVPANTRARVYVPSESGTPVKEGGEPLEKVPGIKVGGQEGRFLVCEAEPGRYRFESTWKD